MRSSRRLILFKLSVVAASIGFTLLLCEVGVRVLGMADHMVTDPAFEQPEDSRIPYRYRSNFTGQVHGQTRFSTNSFGCRDREYPEARQPGSLRVVAMGDSCTFGQGVKREETFAELLERDLPAEVADEPVEVINFGVQGYSIRLMVDRYEYDASRFSPDVAILAFIAEDLHRFREDVFIDSHGYLTRVEGGFNRIKGYLRRSHLMYLLKTQYMRFATRDRAALGRKKLSDEFLQQRLEFLAEQVSRFVGLCRADGVLPIVTYIDLERTPAGEAIVETMNREFPDLVFVDATASLSRWPLDDLVASPQDGHPGVKAHGIIADEVRSDLLGALDESELARAIP